MLLSEKATSSQYKCDGIPLLLWFSAIVAVCAVIVYLILRPLNRFIIGGVLMGGSTSLLLLAFCYYVTCRRISQIIGEKKRRKTYTKHHWIQIHSRHDAHESVVLNCIHLICFRLSLYLNQHPSIQQIPQHPSYQFFPQSIEQFDHRL